MREEDCVLLVEDNPTDEELTCHVLATNGLLNGVVVARDGAEALDYMFGHGRYEGRDANNVPIVVLLDLNLPKLSGLEVLRAIRADDRTRLVPVVVLTSSTEDGDLDDSYQQLANGYVVKPVAYQDFVRAVERLGLFWLLTNHPLPQHLKPALASPSASDGSATVK